MQRRQFLQSALFTGILAAQSKRPPNIVILLADDLGWGELGCQGNPEIPTPHIDSIARNGVRFTNGYSSAPFCSPSRAGLLTGRLQTRFGHELNVIGARNLDPSIGLPLSEKTLASHLKENGYATATVGKWHLGADEKYHPLCRGFDEFFGFLHEGHYFVPPPYEGAVSHLRPKEPPYDANNPLLRGREEVVEKEYLTNAFAREAVDFIQRQPRQKPFFLYVPWNAIHSPMQAEAASQARFAHISSEHRRVFAGMLSALDDGVGRIFAALRQVGAAEDTLLFFLSDNGGPTAELTSSNKPLRGGKGQLYEGGIRVPFLLQWPRQIPAGQTVHDPVMSTDIVPTALAAASVKSEASAFDGINLTPALRKKATIPDRILFWRYGKNIALRWGRWKLVKQNSPTYQLFDLSADPNETKDLAAIEPQRAKQMETALLDTNKRMLPPLWE
jgi:arylsulfatase A-like enzyme